MALITEASIIQFPLVQHATGVGWDFVSPDASAAKRRGGTGYDPLADKPATPSHPARHDVPVWGLRRMGFP